MAEARPKAQILIGRAIISIQHLRTPSSANLKEDILFLKKVNVNFLLQNMAKWCFFIIFDVLLNFHLCHPEESSCYQKCIIFFVIKVQHQYQLLHHHHHPTDLYDQGRLFTQYEVFTNSPDWPFVWSSILLSFSASSIVIRNINFVI